MAEKHDSPKQSNNKDTILIVPVYNEGKVIKKVIEQALKEFPHIVCINDGSADNSAEEVLKTRATLINHPFNMGQGAALQTGIEYALRNPEIQYFVTYDADGQHQLKDVQSMLAYIKNHQVDIVIGSRFLGKAENISTLKKVILKMAIIFSNTATGLHLTDAHNGLRVFNRRFAEKINITMPDMSHATEIIQRIAETKTPYKELPTTIVYNEYTVVKSHNPNLNAVNIVFDTLLGKVTKKWW